VAIVCFNFNYDLSSDAQAAIGLIFFSVEAAIIGLFALILGVVLQKLDRRANQFLKWDR